MARILKWQEKLVLACAALLFSVTSGFGLGPRDTLSGNRPSSSRVVTVVAGKSGVELTAHNPYVRLIRASFAPVSLPLATGAYVAMAGAMGAAAPPDASGTAAPDAAAASSCGGGCGAKGCGTTTACFREICTEHGDGSYTCESCGRGTCTCC